MFHFLSVRFFFIEFSLSLDFLLLFSPFHFCSFHLVIFPSLNSLSGKNKGLYIFSSFIINI